MVVIQSGHERACVRSRIWHYVQSFNKVQNVQQMDGFQI